MINAKDLNFDLFLPRMNVQSQKRVFDLLAFSISARAGVSQKALSLEFEKRLSERTFGMGDGVAIFDVKSECVKRSTMVVSTFEHKLDFNALDDQPVDIMVALISPKNDVPKHLQKLSVLSRAMRSEELCAALRDAKDIDAMRALFLPSQDWMVAA